MCGLASVVVFRMHISDFGFPYSVLRTHVFSVAWSYLKVLCVETVTSCWRLGVIQSLAVAAALCGSSVFYL